MKRGGRLKREWCIERQMRKRDGGPETGRGRTEKRVCVCVCVCERERERERESEQVEI